MSQTDRREELKETYFVLPDAIRIEKCGDETVMIDPGSGKEIFCHHKITVKTDLSNGKQPKAKITFECNLLEIKFIPDRQMDLDLGSEAKYAAKDFTKTLDDMGASASISFISSRGKGEG